MTVGKLVVGIDGSPGAQRALAWALDEGRFRDALVEVVTVYQPVAYTAIPHYPYTASMPELEDKLREEFREHARSLLDEALEGVGGSTGHRGSGLARLNGRAHGLLPTAIATTTRPLRCVGSHQFLLLSRAGGPVVTPAAI